MSTTITSDQISHTYGYAWLGTAGKSASTLTRDGVEQRRNLCTNPGFEVDTTGWSTSGVTALTYAWTGAPNASPSTESLGGVVKRTNYASMGNATAYNDTRIDDATPVTGWHSARFTVGSQNSAIRWDVNGRGIASKTPIAGSVRIYNPGSTAVTMSVDVGDAASTVTQIAAGGTAVLRAVATPEADGIYQFFDLTGLTDNSVIYFSEVIIEAGVQSTGTFFDGSTASSSRGLDVLRSTSAAHAGSASLQVRWRGQPSSAAMYATTTFSGLALDTDYMASFWISIPTRLLKPITLSIVTTTGVVGSNPITLQDATAGWQRIVIPFRTATNRTAASLWIYDPNVYLAGVVTQSIYIDDMLAETGGAVLPYFDGATLSYVEFENTKPLVLNGWQEAATSLNIVHPVVGGGVDVTLRDASLRSGSFELVYEDEDDAAAAFAMHRRRSTFTISDSDRASVSMTYVVDGQISRALDDETREYWLVRVEYQEV